MGLEQRSRNDAFKNIIISMTGNKYPNIKVLDVASGGFCVIKTLIEEGIDYTAIEIRQANVDTLSKELSSFSNVKVILGDATKINELELNQFDIVIIPGLLYHLNPEDNLKVLKDALALAQAGIIIDTVMVDPKASMLHYYDLDGYIYEGRALYEHQKTDDAKLVESRIRASVQKGDERYLSYVMTEDSFVRLLRKLGCQMVSRYKYSPGINEAPTRPPKTGDESIPWTALMSSERGMLAVYLDPNLVKKDAGSGYFHCSNGEGEHGDLSLKQLDDSKENLYNLIVENINSDNIFDIIHNAGRMLPLSLHHLIVEAGIQAKLELLDIVELRIYAESYIKALSINREQQANQIINSYLEYLSLFGMNWAVSMAITFRAYLFNFMLPSTRDLVINWVNKK